MAPVGNHVLLPIWWNLGNSRENFDLYLSPLVCLLGSFYLVCFYAYEILFSKVVSKMAQKVSLGQFLQNQEKDEIYEIKFRLVQEKIYDTKDAEMPRLSVSQVKDTKDWQNKEKLTSKNFVESHKCNKFHRRFRKTKRNVRIWDF